MGRLLERWIRRAAGIHDDIAIDLIPLAEPTAGGRAVAASRIKEHPTLPKNSSNSRAGSGTTLRA